MHTGMRVIIVTEWYSIGMGQISHIIMQYMLNVHVYKVTVKITLHSFQTCLEALSDSILTAYKRKT